MGKDAKRQWFQVRVSEGDKQRVRELAAEAGLSESEFIRRRALGEASSGAASAPGVSPRSVSPREPRGVLDELKALKG